MDPFATIKDICPIAGISFPLNPTMTMLLGPMSALRIPMCCKVEGKITFSSDPESRGCKLSRGFPLCKVMMSVSLCDMSRSSKLWLEEIRLLACGDGDPSHASKWVFSDPSEVGRSEPPRGVTLFTKRIMALVKATRPLQW